MTRTPANTPALDDPGDDTARRFVYQWTYASIVACGLLDESLGLQEVFCEHHEDVLVRHSDDTYTGHQIKTRLTSGDPWKSTDDAIFSACCRFVTLECRFGAQFRAFIIATNHTFVTNKKTKYCLPYLLEQAASATDATAAPTPLKPFLGKLAAQTNCPESICLAALKKCRCDDSFPKMEHIKQGLVRTIVESWDGATEQPLQAVARAAEALIGACQRASSLDHQQSLPLYISPTQQPNAAENALLAGKRISRASLEEILQGALNPTSLLAGSLADVPPITSSHRYRLDAKLRAGGLSEVSINSAKDLRDKAEYRSLEWIQRLGDADGLRRHDHIRSVVLRDCADAFEEAKQPGDSFGRPMRDALRERFRRRRATGAIDLFGCLDEHLEGYAYSLTGECLVWWSEPFALPGEE